ncbi:hypothetical protein SPI_08927 [Niveomyces insectorum RCEF 264]|uniref:Uncharacterized protein n=1 Tax=Niveomyces insectorum RCEF 264 TaxID=1081102 RepID=A0A167MG21_9HYPO|nr:hypothetical protein SPI_08927 [Niveomyces insectorum RCEF 264]
MATGLRVWYVRSLVHETTSVSGGDKDPDDPHFTVFVDREPNLPADEDFDYSGHLYVAVNEQGDPHRFLEEEEFMYQAENEPAPVWLYDLHDPEVIGKFWPELIDEEYGEEEGYEEPAMQKDKKKTKKEEACGRWRHCLDEKALCIQCD